MSVGARTHRAADSLAPRLAPPAQPSEAPKPQREPLRPRGAPRWTRARLGRRRRGRARRAVFFLVMAVHNGWIDEAARVVLAFLASTTLLVAGVWLYERKAPERRPRAPPSPVCDRSALRSAHRRDQRASPRVHGSGLAVAGLIARRRDRWSRLRWDSRSRSSASASIGALLAPVLVGAGTTQREPLFMAFALVGAVAQC